MARGISLHVGVNRVDLSAFRARPLRGCVNDAHAMSEIARRQGFDIIAVMTDEGATYRNVMGALRAAAAELKDGDLFLFTFAGHGTQVNSGDVGLPEPGEPDDPELQDETLVLHDFILIDDVLRRRVWPTFASGVRILMVADSCHSGSVALATSVTSIRRSATVSFTDSEVAVTASIEVSTTEITQDRDLSPTATQEHLRTFPEFYKRELSKPSGGPTRASVLLLAACTDEQKAVEGPTHGVFTKALVDVWAGGSFVGSHEDFRDAIREAVRLDPVLVRPQHPQLTPSDPPDPAFVGQRPFTISPP